MADAYHTWKTFNINRNQIEHETERAVLIKMPNKGRYAGWTFWWPKKLVKEGPNRAAVTIVYNPMMSEFKVFKSSPKTFKRLGEDTLSADDILEEFEVTNDNISAPEKFTPYTEEKKAPKLDPLPQVKVLEDLRNE